METTEPNRGTNPDAGMLDLSSGRTTAADGPTQPITSAPELAQPPPSAPASQRPASAGESSIGAALWLAFVFGIGVTIFQSLARTGLAQIDQRLQLSVIGGPRLWLFALLAVSIDLALPVVVILVAWRTRRSASAPGIRSVVGALVALVALTVGPGALVYTLSLTSVTAPLGAALVDVLAPGFPAKFFASLSLDVSFFVPASVILALPAAYAWGGGPPGAVGSGAARGRALVRWLAVALSATFGLILYSFAYTVISFNVTASVDSSAAPQLWLPGAFQVYNVTPSLFFTVIGAVVGGALGSAGAAIGAEATGAPTPILRQPMRWGRFGAVGALLLALGMATSAWLPGVLIALTQTTMPPPIALPGLAILVPTLILIVALISVFRRLGADVGWRTLAVAALSYAPLVVSVIGLGLLQRLDGNPMFSLLLGGAPLAFGVGVALAVVFGAPNRTRWRGRAAAIGAALGVGYALISTIQAAAGVFTPQVACSGSGGCGPQTAFLFGMLLAAYAFEGLALTLVGATVGGWLRARAAR